MLASLSAALVAIWRGLTVLRGRKVARPRRFLFKYSMPRLAAFSSTVTIFCS